jgi:multidrug resistance efflux pump
VPDTNPATGKDYPNNASSGQAERYYAEFVAAEAAMHAAEDQLGSAKIGYDAARAAEATGVQTAEQQVALAQAQLAKLRAGASRADIQQAETALASAQRTLDTLTGIREKPLGAQSARDAAQAQVSGAEAALAQAQARLDALKAGARPEQIQAAEAQRDQARAALQQVEVQLGKAQLTAPRAGLVLERPIHEGEQVSPGTSLMTVGSLDTVRLTLYIAESQIGQVRQGQKVSVSVDSFPGRTFDGTVTFIAQQAQFTPRNVQTQAERVTTVFAVRVDLPNPDHALKPGMPADAIIK